MRLEIVAVLTAGPVLGDLFVGEGLLESPL